MDISYFDMLYNLQMFLKVKCLKVNTYFVLQFVFILRELKNIKQSLIWS